jgi:hypothetical protein
MAITLPDSPAEQRGVGPGWKVQAVELAVFLFLLAPSLLLSLFAVRQGSLPFVLVAVATIVRDLGLVAAVLYFLWRNGEGVARIGWTARHGRKEAILGAALFVPLYFATALLGEGLLRAGLSAPKTPLPSFLKAQGSAEKEDTVRIGLCHQDIR